MSEMNSPFRYPGGKFYARKLIVECIVPHTYYGEPFAGGASIFFAKKKAPHTILNDADPELINCYLTIRDNVEGLIKLLHGIHASKENHHYFKQVYQPTNDLERAFRWYYLNNAMCKYSCQRKGSWSLLPSEELQISEEGSHEPGRFYYHMFLFD